MTSGRTGARKGKFLSPAEMEEAIKTLTKEAADQDIETAVCGGYAMQHYGSDRLTTDVDLVADGRLRGYKATDTLSFGGVQIKAPNDVPVDWIVRDDDFADLYKEALEKAKRLRAGFRIITPDYLAALKLAAGRPKDHDDLVFLLQQPRLVNVKAAEKIVYELIGGQFAKQEFERIVEEAQWLRHRATKT